MRDQDWIHPHGNVCSHSTLWGCSVTNVSKIVEDICIIFHPESPWDAALAVCWIRCEFSSEGVVRTEPPVLIWTCCLPGLQNSTQKYCLVHSKTFTHPAVKPIDQWCCHGDWGHIPKQEVVFWISSLDNRFLWVQTKTHLLDPFSPPLSEMINSTVFVVLLPSRCHSSYYSPV